MVNTFNSRSTLQVGTKKYHYHSLPAAEKAGLKNISRLPFALKVLLENQLRHEDGQSVTRTDIAAFSAWLDKKKSKREIAHRPARVLMQDFTGVPAVVDLAAMRDAITRLQGDGDKINPLCPVDLIIDHSVQVDRFGNKNAFAANVRIEMQRNIERYRFLKWGQHSLENFNVVPPGTGICHQVNLEYLGKAVQAKQINSEWHAYPDTLVGTDSHTTMINGLGVLGWGVGGIEAEAALLGQPISMLIPEVVGFRLAGQLPPGVTATDLVLTVTQMLRNKGVVGKFVEFYGPGLQGLPLADRATIANMAPEYGATCGLFPIDQETIKYMTLSGRSADTIELVIAYTKAQGMWHDENSSEPIFSDTLNLDLATVEPSVAGPKRPQDRVVLTELPAVMQDVISKAGRESELTKSFASTDDFTLRHGDIVIAAITSCTNTSNPSVMLAAGLLAKKAVEQGLTVKPWVKTSLAPGSKVVTDYLHKTNLSKYLAELGFYLAGYGCTTCIGNSGPLPDAVAKSVSEHDLIACAVLSGNRNFEGRIHPLVKANWLASPPLVVAFALAGTMNIDLHKQPLGTNTQGQPVYLQDIWPSDAEISEASTVINQSMFQQEYAQIFIGDSEWQSIAVAAGSTYQWQPESTYIRNPPFFDTMNRTPDPIGSIQGARILALLGDSVTTDHISPAGAIKPDSPAGKYLTAHGVEIADYNSFGSRRGNHEVLMRGTFGNIRIRNEMVPGVEGGFTKHYPSGEQLTIYDAAMKYKADNIPLVVIAGKEYGTGSSRDWAAKGPCLLGVKVVVAESFERIHRSNLIGMGVLPLEFKDGMNRTTLKLDGSEHIDIVDLDDSLKPGSDVTLAIHYHDHVNRNITLRCRIDTDNELEYYRHGGILPFVLRNMLTNNT